MIRSGIRAALLSMYSSSLWPERWDRVALRALLTGMGKDGAQGLLAARQAGAMTFAQNEASSVVFGMPGEAIRLGAAQRVLSIEEIAPTLVALTSNMKAGRAL